MATHGHPWLPSMGVLPSAGLHASLRWRSDFGPRGHRSERPSVQRRLESSPAPLAPLVPLAPRPMSSCHQLSSVVISCLGVPMYTKSRQFMEATYAKVLLTCWSNLDILWHDYASILNHVSEFRWFNMFTLCYMVWYLHLLHLSQLLHRRRFSGSWADDRKLHQDAYKVQHCVVEAPHIFWARALATCHHTLQQLCIYLGNNLNYDPNNNMLM